MGAGRSDEVLMANGYDRGDKLIASVDSDLVGVWKRTKVPVASWCF